MADTKYQSLPLGEADPDLQAPYDTQYTWQHYRALVSFVTGWLWSHKRLVFADIVFRALRVGCDIILPFQIMTILDALGGDLQYASPEEIKNTLMALGLCVAFRFLSARFGPVRMIHRALISGPLENTLHDDLMIETLLRDPRPYITTSGKIDVETACSDIVNNTWSILVVVGDLADFAEALIGRLLGLALLWHMFGEYTATFTFVISVAAVCQSEWTRIVMEKYWEDKASAGDTRCHNQVVTKIIKEQGVDNGSSYSDRQREIMKARKVLAEQAKKEREEERKRSGQYLVEDVLTALVGLLAPGYCGFMHIMNNNLGVGHLVFLALFLEWMFKDLADLGLPGRLLWPSEQERKLHKLATRFNGSRTKLTSDASFQDEKSAEDKVD